MFTVDYRQHRIRLVPSRRGEGWVPNAVVYHGPRVQMDGTLIQGNAQAPCATREAATEVAMTRAKAWIDFRLLLSQPPASQTIKEAV